MARVETGHRTVDGKQRTTKRVIIEDPTGGEHVYEFEGPPDGDVDDYEYAGEGVPGEDVLEELAEHLGEDLDANEGEQLTADASGDVLDLADSERGTPEPSPAYLDVNEDVDEE